jgi:hypothetical protein
MSLPRAIPPGTIAGGAYPGTNNPSSSSNKHSISTGSAIALVVSTSVVLIGIIILAFYFLYWRNRTPRNGKHTSRFGTPAMEEWEIDEDGMKIDIRREQKKKGTWWGRRRGSVQSADTFVQDGTVSSPPAVVVRSQK